MNIWEDKAVPSYTKKDRVGRQLSCSCVPLHKFHEYCQNCLILVGEGHFEELLFDTLLPVVTDSFDEEQGYWVRGRSVVAGKVCQTCYEIAESGQAYTLRILPIEPAVRRKRVEEWAYERGILPPKGGHGRHVGAFTRV